MLSPTEKRESLFFFFLGEDAAVDEEVGIVGSGECSGDITRCLIGRGVIIKVL